MRILPLVVMALMSGCAARMVETHGGSKYGPKNEGPGGRVQYISTGLSGLVEARREDAYKQMFEACNGSYNIVREFDEPNGSVTSGSSQNLGGGYTANSAYTSQSMLRVIEFACVPANAPAPIPQQ